MRVSCELFELTYPINLAQLHISIENDSLFCYKTKNLGMFIPKWNLLQRSRNRMSKQVDFHTQTYLKIKTLVWEDDHNLIANNTISSAIWDK